MRSRGETSLASVIRWYIDASGSISQWHRSKQAGLEFLERHEIGKVDVLKLTTERLVDHIRNRRETGVCGATANNDLIWIGSRSRQPMRDVVSIDISALEKARDLCRKLRLLTRSNRRDRRPTNEELQRLDE